MSTILLFNKPFGVLSQFTGGPNELTLSHYISLPNYYAAGRLDKNSEGLLLLTDNGLLQHKLSHPNYSKRKYYWVQVEGRPTKQDFKPLIEGLSLKGINFLPAQVRLIAEPTIWKREPPIRVRKLIPTTWLEIILQEGKNHQIRKMTAAIGFPTLRLIRYQIADWALNELLPGEYKKIIL